MGSQISPNDGSSWKINFIDSTNHVGFSTSIALDSNNQPHISYYCNTNLSLKYAHYYDSAWSVETVDSISDVGMYSSLSI